MNSPSGRPPATAEDAVRQVSLACRIIARFGQEDLTLGHASVRGPDGRTVYIKRKGKALRDVLAEDVIGITLDDPDGHLTRTRTSRRSCTWRPTWPGRTSAR